MDNHRMTDQPSFFPGYEYLEPRKPDAADTYKAEHSDNLPLFSGIPESVTLPDVSGPVTVYDYRDPDNPKVFIR